MNEDVVAQNKRSRVIPTNPKQKSEVVKTSLWYNDTYQEDAVAQ